MIKAQSITWLLVPLVMLTALQSCRSKKKTQTTEVPKVVEVKEDTLNGKCRLDYKSAKTLSRNMKDSQFDFVWVNAKANVQTLIDEKEESFDIRVKMRKDSAMLISIQYLLGVDVARVMITRDSVKFVNYIEKKYFKGDFNYINALLNADLDYDLLQAVLFGNSAEFHEDETRLKPVADRQNCHYLLSTEKKRRLRRIQQGAELKDALQTLTLNPDNYKILKNEFIDPTSNRMFIAVYSNFAKKDSVFAPYHVDIDMVAQKKATVKIDYVRIEKNSPQKLSINIPAKYEPITVPTSPK